MKDINSTIHRRQSGHALRPVYRLLPGAVLGLCLSGSAIAAPPGTLPFGAYDTDGRFSRDSEVSIEHVYLPWEGIDLESLQAADIYARERGRKLLVTIEPWIWGAPLPPAALRSEILSGNKDATMRSICSVLGTLQSDVTVRWAQEMDSRDGHFPWSNWNPADYIEAYRRMVGVCRAEAPEAQYMWSPAGEEGLAAYYPGDDVVDVIGLSVFGVQDYHREVFGTEQGYTDILAPRYERVAPFGKPIQVSELGYVGDDAYLDRWHNAVRQPDSRFPELTAVIYFNRQETFPWPGDTGLPDWREGALPGN